MPVRPDVLLTEAVAFFARSLSSEISVLTHQFLPLMQSLFLLEAD